MRKPIAKHVVHRKTKSGKVVTFTRGKGAKKVKPTSKGKAKAGAEFEKKSSKKGSMELSNEEWKDWWKGGTDSAIELDNMLKKKLGKNGYKELYAQTTLAKTKSFVKSSLSGGKVSDKASSKKKVKTFSEEVSSGKSIDEAKKLQAEKGIAGQKRVIEAAKKMPGTNPATLKKLEASLAKKEADYAKSYPKSGSGGSEKAVTEKEVKSIARKLGIGSTNADDESAKWSKRGGHAGDKKLSAIREKAKAAGWKHKKFDRNDVPDGSHHSSTNTMVSPDGQWELQTSSGYGSTARSNSYDAEVYHVGTRSSRIEKQKAHTASVKAKMDKMMADYVAKKAATAKD